MEKKKKPVLQCRVLLLWLLLEAAAGAQKTPYPTLGTAAEKSGANFAEAADTCCMSNPWCLSRCSSKGLVASCLQGDACWEHGEVRESCSVGSDSMSLSQTHLSYRVTLRCCWQDLTLDHLAERCHRKNMLKVGLGLRGRWGERVLERERKREREIWVLG